MQKVSLSSPTGTLKQVVAHLSKTAAPTVQNLLRQIDAGATATTEAMDPIYYMTLATFLKENAITDLMDPPQPDEKYVIWVTDPGEKYATNLQEFKKALQEEIDQGGLV